MALHEPNCLAIANQGTVFSVAFSPDGNMIAAGTTGMVSLFDSKTGYLLAQLYHPDGKNLYFHSVAFLPHSDDMQRDSTLAAGCADGNIYLWSTSHCNLSQRSAAGKLIGHDGSVRSILFTGDGKRLISGSDDCSIRIWNMSSHEQLIQLSGHIRDVASVASVGNKIVSGSFDRSVRIWDASTGVQLLQMNEHTNTVLSVACSPDRTMPQSEIIASGGSDNSVRLWDMSTGQQVAKLDGHVGCVSSVAFSPDGRLISSACWDGTVCLWICQLGDHLTCLREIL